MTTQNLVHGSDAGRWEQAIYAFLAEKERRSGSMRTVRAYSGMLYRFFGNVGKQPDQVTSPEVFGYAHGIGLSGKEPSSVTINARIACLSSFYRFLIRMSLVSANPCDQLERPRATPAPPRGLTAADIKKLLDFIPDNPVGLRDRAIILTLILTGRRRAEVLNLKVSDLTRIHRRTALGTALEEARGCSSESGIMVLEHKPARKQGAPNRCRHRTIPTVSASSLTTIAWWPMPACSCRPPSPGAWACGNSSTITLTSAARRDGRTLGTRC